jgi:FkbM family methyltransferase
MTLRQPIAFDRSTGDFGQATRFDRLMARAFQTGSKATALCHHRGFALGCRVLAPMIPERDIVVQLADDAHFAFPFGDGYWGLLLDRSFNYEDEINWVLASAADVDYAFVDGGANFGFWSVLASSRAFGSHPVLAIEASQANYARLVLNAELNGGRFKTLHRGIGSSKGRAWLQGHKHYAFSIGDRRNGTEGEQIELMTLDDVLDDPLVAPHSRLIVKLDIEGMEIGAIKGGRNLQDREVMLIVEDHGSDRTHAVSRFILNETPYRPFVFDPAIGQFRPLRDVSILDRIKASASLGYNVFATNSPLWEQRLNCAPESALGQHPMPQRAA